MHLEHANLTVSDPHKSAESLQRIFGWHVRWEGEALLGGHTVHVGTDDTYLALYTLGEPQPASRDNYTTVGALNHIGVVVDDLDATAKLVEAEGFATFNQADYEPGRRFYFNDRDGIEFEVVSYR